MLEIKFILWLNSLTSRADAHLWAETYDRELTAKNLFAIQSDVAKKITTSLKGQLLEEEEQQLDQKPTDNLEAYTAYLQGDEHLRRLDYTEIRNAITYYERAIELDSTFAEAHAALGNAYAIASTDYGGFVPEQGFKTAKEYGLRALSLNPTIVAARTLLGDILFWHEWNWQEAELEYKLVIELDPNYVGSRLSYAYLLSARNRHQEAIEQIERCLELDPKSPSVFSNAAWRYLNARDYPSVIKCTDEVLKMDPGNRDALVARAWALLYSGQTNEAIKVFLEHGYPPHRGYALAISGRIEEAKAILEEFHQQSKEGYVPPTMFIMISMGLKDFDEAFKWMEVAFQDRTREILLLDGYQIYDDLRGDPTFEAFRQRLDLAPWNE